MPLAVFLLLWVLLLPSGAVAQTFDGCMAGGRPVPTFYDDRAPGPAFGGNGRIVINRIQIRAFSPTHQKFIYWHECGHVVLNHQGTAADEMAADCIAYQFLVSTGNLTRGEVLQIAREMSQMTGDWTHLPGPARVQHLSTCGPLPAPVCRNVVVPEQYQAVETQPQRQMIRCQHCGCTPGRGCGCLHPYDEVVVPTRVPVLRTRMVTRRVCD